MRLGCRKCFPRQRLQRKPLVSDPGMHSGTGVAHVPWCMTGSLTRGGGENVPGFPGACTTRNFTLLAKSPLLRCYPYTVGTLDTPKCQHSWEDQTHFREITLLIEILHPHTPHTHPTPHPTPHPNPHPNPPTPTPHPTTHTWIKVKKVNEVWI